MKEKIKIICLILITLSFLIGTGFYCWQVYRTQLYYQLERQKEDLAKQENLKIHQECMTRLKNRRDYVKQGLVPLIGLQEGLEFYKNWVKDIKEVGGLEKYKEILFGE